MLLAQLQVLLVSYVLDAPVFEDIGNLFGDGTVVMGDGIRSIEFDVTGNVLVEQRGNGRGEEEVEEEDEEDEEEEEEEEEGEASPRANCVWSCVACD